MFWALASGAIDTRGFEFEHVLRDIQTLNEWALEGRLEVTALSLHSYPLVQDHYVLLPHGATSARRRCASSRRCSASRSRRASRTGARRWPTRSSTGAASTTSWPTASSGCT